MGPSAWREGMEGILGRTLAWLVPTLMCLGGSCWHLGRPLGSRAKRGHSGCIRPGVRKHRLQMLPAPAGGVWHGVMERSRPGLQAVVASVQGCPGSRDEGPQGQ